MRRRSGPGARYLAAGAPVIGLLMIFVPGGAGAGGVTHLAHLHHGPVHHGAVHHGAVHHGTGVRQGAARVQHSAQALAAARTEIRSLEIGQPARNVRVTSAGQDPSVKGSAVSSSNWSGYADDDTSGNAYSEVSGTWVEPSITCGAQEQSLAAFWVGIDGYSDSTVEQDGTLAQCDDGSIFYYTWWEMYPTNTAQIIGTTVSPGDTIVASVVQSGANYTLSLTDASDSADSFTTTQSCTDCTNSSAEWIAEAPTSVSSNEIVSLSDFRDWSLSNASVKSGSKAGVISTFPDDQITMVNASGGIEATTENLASGGNQFTVIWGQELPVVESRTPPPGRPAGSPVPARTPPPR